MKRNSMGGLFLALAAILVAGIVRAEDKVRPLILGSTIDPPLIWHDGVEPRGFQVELLADILPKAGVPEHQILFFDSTARNLEEAKLGKIDVVVSLSRKPDRELFLDYPNVPYLELSWHFVIRLEDVGKIKFDHFDDLKDLSIGVVDKNAYAQILPADLNYHVTQVEQNLFPMLIAKRIDAIPMNYPEAAYVAKHEGYANRVHILATPFRTAPYFITWSKTSTYPNKSAVMAKLDKIIAEKRDDGSLKALYDRHVSLTQ